MPDPDLATLRRVLVPLARMRTTLSYAQLAAALGLGPPHSIRRAALALEALMAEDAAARLPFLACVVVSPRRGGLPAPGFFERARALGRMAPGADPAAFHADELAALHAQYPPS
jgi:hypothetical protein